MPELLELRDNGTAHDDVHLSFENLQEVTDSYYFALDNEIAPEDESVAKARQVLKRLLEQWKHHLCATSDGAVVYLPYDFSDQYTGCLRCERMTTDLVITHGYSGREGWSFNPSDISNFVNTVDDFHIGSIANTGSKPEGIRIGFDRFLKSIDAATEAATSTKAEQDAPSNGGQRSSLNSGFPPRRG